jgi:hypothetical protein
MTRRGSLSAFGAFGIFWGAWAVLLPAIKEQTGASVAELGVALLFVAAAALPPMLATGALIDRFGPRLIPTCSSSRPSWMLHQAWPASGRRSSRLRWSWDAPLGTSSASASATGRCSRPARWSRAAGSRWLRPRRPCPSPSWDSSWAGPGSPWPAPVLFGTAGRGAAGTERGRSVATVTTISYLGFLGGPPLIGLVSGALDLRAGIALLAGIAVATSVAASSLGDALSLRRQQHPAPGEVP